MGRAAPSIRESYRSICSNLISRLRNLRSSDRDLAKLLDFNGVTSTLTTNAFKFAAQRGTEKCNPQRARKARRRSHFPIRLQLFLSQYKEECKPNAQGFLFVTRNGRPPSSNKVVEYRLWPILDALDIPRCGLHAFRHSVASFIVDAGYAPEVAQQQLRHSNAQTTLGYIHLRGGITEQAMADIANSLKLDVVGRNSGKGSQYIQ